MRWIVPNAPGGGYDVSSRQLATHLEKVLGSEIRVDNVTGASGVLGARVLRDARPDGRTVGILNASGLMLASLSDTAVPNPAEDFAILGRINRTQYVWATGASSGIRSMEDVFRQADGRGVVFAINTTRSLSLAVAAGACSLLGIQADYVAGYDGSRQSVLAAIRGEVDLIAYSADAILDLIQAGDLRTVLQISEQPIAGVPMADQLPWLGGPNGLARSRASLLGRRPGQVQDDAATLVSFTSTGRIVAAPQGLAPGLRQCLSSGICEALDMLARETPSMQDESACADAAREEVQAAYELAPRLMSIVEAAKERARGAGL